MTNGVYDKELLAEKSEDEPPYIDGDEVDSKIINKKSDIKDNILKNLQKRVGQQITVAELNSMLQSMFSRYNDIFIIESDIYNADLDETQKLTIWEDEKNYIIHYDIIDVESGLIEIVDVDVE